MDASFTDDQVVELLAFALVKPEPEATKIAVAALLNSSITAARSLRLALERISPNAENVAQVFYVIGHHVEVDSLRNIVDPAYKRVCLHVSQALDKVVEEWPATDRIDKAKKSITLSDRELVVANLIIDSEVDSHNLSTLIQILLFDSDTRLRVRAHKAIESLAIPFADSLFEAMDRKVVPFTDELAHVLCDLQDGRGTDYLSALLRDRSRNELEEGIFEKKAIPIIDTLAKISDEQAIRQLVLLLADRRYVPAIRFALEAVGSRAADCLLDAFTTHLGIRSHEAELVAQVAGAHAADALIRALHDRYRAVRENAEIALELLGEAVVPILIDAIDGTDELVRMHILRILGNIGDSQALDPISKIVREGSQNERLVAVEALGGFPHFGAAIELLNEALGAFDPELRKRAAKAARRIKDSQRIVDLATECRNQDWRARLRGVEDLTDDKTKRTYTENVRIAKIIIPTLLDSSKDVSAKAAQALINMGEPARKALEAIHGTMRTKLDDVLVQINKNREQKRFRVGSLHSPDPEPDTQIPLAVTDNVHFSVTAPHILTLGDSFILDVWVHPEGTYDEVIKRGRRAQRNSQIRTRTKGPVPLKQGTVMEVFLDIPDFDIREARDTIYWLRTIGNCTFAITVPQDAAAGYHFGTLSFLVSGLLIARLQFDLKIGVARQQVEDVSAREVRIKSAFASYASQDRDRVLDILQGVCKAFPGLDIFLDVASLRSGERWQQRLSEEIAIRDIFYLFWSLAASRSPWVEKEWQTALATRGIDYINPFPLEPPTMAPPPPELASLHFNEWTLAYRSAAKT
jgi:HEAT repeat protein